MLTRPGLPPNTETASGGGRREAQNFWLEFAQNPLVLPPVFSQVSLRFDEDFTDPNAFAGITLPDDVIRAIPKRQFHFAAGRYCAQEALRRLDPSRPPEVVSRDTGGAPLWPSGTTGSITHTVGFVSAAVAWSRDVASVGIDSERIMSAAQARAVAMVIAWPSELARAREAGLDRLQAMTLAFSAKEALFKCVHPLVQRMVGFHDVRVVKVDSNSRVFELRIVKALASQFPTGTIVRGRFHVDEPWIHTGMLIPVTPTLCEHVNPAAKTDLPSGACEQGS